MDDLSEPAAPAAAPARVFVLGAPGTFVRARPDRLVVGSRPGAVHGAVSGMLLLVALYGAALFWSAEPFLALLLLVLFGLPPLLAVASPPRYEVERGLVRRGGRVAGKVWPREWPLPSVSLVRVAERTAGSRRVWQAQVGTAAGWLALAESAEAAQAQAFAAQVAQAAGVPLREAPA